MKSGHFEGPPSQKTSVSNSFCWGYWNSKETHQNWPLGLIIHHFKCHGSYLSSTNFWQKSIKNWMGPYQRTPKKKVTRAIKYTGLGVRSVGPVGDFLEKKHATSNTLRHKNPLKPFFCFPQFSSHQKHEKKSIQNQPLAKNFRRGNTSRSDKFFPKKTSDSLKRSRKAIFYLSKPVPRVKLRGFCVVWRWQP